MKTRKSKRKIIIIAAACILFATLFILFVRFQYSISKGGISRYVKTHQTELTAYINQLDRNVVVKEDNWNGMRVTWSFEEQSKMIMFEVYYFGFPSTFNARGFYYSPDDEPLPYSAGSPADYPLESKGSEWVWNEPDGDNWYKTEKIMDCWYYYQMHW
ncbi:MAG: hypothetical protein LKG56_00995 [Lachnospiraceae bacterium]|jgi:hypothetical protein|nr:hypothetical protein [Lachnospiraceae bacterium]MCH4030266.1 hypothetical protein [Lachnospiraceae bacterium]MCH4069478.1 hypothetical protein [Lachnospiraceae bacterium]MCH4107586.1 hypothetical protein [Lachnospiraceae bacterium]MCI1301563.1 hypothetical protein [Lachnospiraceae bacterium]